MMRINYCLKLCLIAGLFSAKLALAAEAPVFLGNESLPENSGQQVYQDNPDAQNQDQTQNQALTNNNSNLTIEQRIAVLERQISALNQINLMNQVNDLQQKLQELQGRVEELSHTLQTLQTQSASQYADLNARLKTSSNDTSVPEQLPSAQPDQTEQNVYQAAYEKVKNQHYSEAIAALQAFIARYPQSSYVPNAHYWTGQMYLLKADGKSAAQEFSLLIKKYPKNSKIKDAQLKLGFAYLLENKTSEAKMQFKKVMALYPKTVSAKLAEARLAQMA